MKYAAVIFDLDGTLLDTLQDLADSMNRVLVRNNLPDHPTAAYKYFVGDGMDNLVKRTLPQEQQDNEDLITELKTAMLADYDQHWNDATRPYNNVPEMLKSLNASGLPVCILSNKPHSFMEVVVATLLDEFTFNYIYGAREDVPIKPDPAGAFQLAELLKLKPEEIIYAGDSSTDMLTGKAAGMFTVGVSWGFRTREELKEHGADAIIDDPLELLELLG